MQFHPEFDRAGVSEKDEQTLFVLAPEQSPTIDQVGFVSDQAINVSIEIGRLFWKLTQHSRPSYECFIDLAGDRPTCAFFQPKIRPLGKEITRNLEIVFCLVFPADGQLSSGAGLIRTPVQRRDTQGSRGEPHRLRIIFVSNGLVRFRVQLLHRHWSWQDTHSSHRCKPPRAHAHEEQANRAKYPRDRGGATEAFRRRNGRTG